MSDQNTPQVTEEDFKGYKVEELKALCLERELTAEGKKDELIARLVEYHSEDDPDTDQKPSSDDEPDTSKTPPNKGVDEESPKASAPKYKLSNKGVSFYCFETKWGLDPGQEKPLPSKVSDKIRSWVTAGGIIKAGN